MVPKPDMRLPQEEEEAPLAVMCFADAAPPSSDGGPAAAAKTFEGEDGALSAAKLLLRQRSRGDQSVSSVSSVREGRATEALCVHDGASGAANQEPSAVSKDASSSASRSAHNEPFENHPVAYSIPFFLLVAYGTKEFSIVFPYVMAPWAASRTYLWAGYQYDEEHTHFDNSAWTWATDYALAALMLILAARCILACGGESERANDASRALRVRSAALLLLYAISTVAGGYAHQTYTSISSMNTPTFRFLWTVCVGSVCAAGGVMGSIGTEVCRRFHADARRKLGEVVLEIPAVPDGFWLCWGLYITAVCVRGDISYHRPACDIFIAGTTQFVPTAYCVLLLMVRRWADNKDGAARIAPSQPACHVRKAYRVAYYLGFVDNSILLPAYPLLVQYTNWSLGTINTLLHAWLTLSWGMQAIGLRHLCLAVDKGAIEAEGN